MSEPITYESIASFMDSLTEERAIAIYRRETLAAWTRMTRDSARWLDANRYVTDRRRYNRARRKAVRSALAGLAALRASGTAETSSGREPKVEADANSR